MQMLFCSARVELAVWGCLVLRCLGLFRVVFGDYSKPLTVRVAIVWSLWRMTNS